MRLSSIVLAIGIVLLLAVPALAYPPNDQYTKALLHMNGTANSTVFTDETYGGGSGHTWAAGGNAQIFTSPSKFGGASGSFPASGNSATDNINSSDSDEFFTGTANWTMDAWVYIVDFNAGGNWFCGQGPTASSSWGIEIYSSYIWWGVQTSGSWTEYNYTNTVVSTGHWHHVAVERDTGNKSSWFKVYFDGTLQTSFQGSTPAGGFNATSVPNIAANMEVGRGGYSHTGSPWGIYGYIDEFRFSQNVRWTSSTMTPPTQEYFKSIVAPVAAFSCTPLVGVRNFTSTCTDSSTNTPTSWDYYSPSPAVFSGNWTNQNPKIFPIRFGYGGICMIATNGGGSSTACKGGTYFYVRKPYTIEIRLLPYFEEYMASTDGIAYALNPLR